MASTGKVEFRSFRLRDLSGLGHRPMLLGSNASLKSEVSRDNLDSLVPRVSCCHNWESRKWEGRGRCLYLVRTHNCRRLAS